MKSTPHNQEMDDNLITQRDYLPDEMIETIRKIMCNNEYVQMIYNSMCANELMVPEDLSDPLFLANCVITLHDAYNVQKEISCRYAMRASPPPVKVGEGIVCI